MNLNDIRNTRRTNQEAYKAAYADPNQVKILQIIGWSAIFAYSYTAYRIVRGVLKIRR